MSLAWIRESPAAWDAAKKRIIGGAPRGIFDTRFGKLADGALVPGEWWRVDDDGRTVAYGWLDSVWGDAEIHLAVAPEAQKAGVGTFIVDHLENEAKDRGLNYIYNVVRTTHPEGSELTRWLEKRGFRAAPDGRLVRGAARRLSIPSTV